jgi:peptide chain release factor 2
MDEKQDLQKELERLEAAMNGADFWTDKEAAQATIRRVQDLKAEIESGGNVGKYDRGNALMSIFSGAGGDDAEDFSKMLLNMYLKFFDRRGFGVKIFHKNENDHGGYRNLTLEITGKNVYGILKNESGVHRLVRISPFNANAKRHTSFSMVEVIPEFEKQSAAELDIPDKDIRVELSRSSGPGGQNVNKRETAVRVVHIPTGIAAASESERSQAQNKEKAMQILYGKIYKALEDERIKKEEGMYISKTTQIEWGNQIRSYVLHPYKMVKDHRTGVETSQVDKVLSGEIDEFLEADAKL